MGLVCLPKTIQLDVRKYGIHGSCWHFFDVHPKKIPSVSLGCSFPSILGGFLNTSGLNNGLEIGGKSRNHWTIHWIIHILQVVRIVSDIFGANSGGAWAGDRGSYPFWDPRTICHMFGNFGLGRTTKVKKNPRKATTKKSTKKRQSDKFIPFFQVTCFFFFRGGGINILNPKRRWFGFRWFSVQFMGHF